MLEEGLLPFVAMYHFFFAKISPFSIDSDHLEYSIPNVDEIISGLQPR